jgi:hypothetical protein
VTQAVWASLVRSRTEHVRTLAAAGAVADGLRVGVVLIPVLGHGGSASQVLVLLQRRMGLGDVLLAEHGLVLVLLLKGAAVAALEARGHVGAPDVGAELALLEHLAAGGLLLALLALRVLRVLDSVGLLLGCLALGADVGDFLVARLADAAARREVVRASLRLTLAVLDARALLEGALPAPGAGEHIVEEVVVAGLESAGEDVVAASLLAEELGCVLEVLVARLAALLDLLVLVRLARRRRGRRRRRRLAVDDLTRLVHHARHELLHEISAVVALDILARLECVRGAVRAVAARAILAALLFGEVEEADLLDLLGLVHLEVGVDRVDMHRAIRRRAIHPRVGNGRRLGRGIEVASLGLLPASVLGVLGVLSVARHGGRGEWGKSESRGTGTVNVNVKG